MLLIRNPNGRTKTEYKRWETASTNHRGRFLYVLHG